MPRRLFLTDEGLRETAGACGSRRMLAADGWHVLRRVGSIGRGRDQARDQQEDDMRLHRVRQAFETVLRVMIDVFEQALRRMDRRPDPGLARLRRYALLAVWCWRARSRIACSPTKYAKPQWTSRYRSDGGRAERRMSGDRARKPRGCVRVGLGFLLPGPAGVLC